MFIVGGGNYIEYQNLMDYSKVSLLSWNNETRLRSPSCHETPVVICMCRDSNYTNYNFLGLNFCKRFSVISVRCKISQASPARTR